ncbi:MAG: AzlD domain-containing protein [Gammaproteobacteria bacterium]|nr:AzlD domain-containing protein [Gammaproteobacteria bacterium]MDH3467380.1 AzlD domain-containing protein [Gammaproteobacteria bacterium]
MAEWPLILGMMGVTLLTRYPLLALTGRIALPQRVFAALRFVPVAVLTAICTPAMFTPSGEFTFALENAYLWAGLLAVAVAWLSRNLLLTIVAGMAFFFVWRWVAGGL